MLNRVIDTILGLLALAVSIGLVGLLAMWAVTL